MKSPAECLERAAKCEDLAQNVWRDSSRQSLLAAATYWRGLAASAARLSSPLIKGWLPSLPAGPIVPSLDADHNFQAIVSSVRTVERLLQRKLSPDRRAHVQGLLQLLLTLQQQALLKSPQATAH